MSKFPDFDHEAADAIDASKREAARWEIREMSQGDVMLIRFPEVNLDDFASDVSESLSYEWWMCGIDTAHSVVKQACMRAALNTAPSLAVEAKQE